MTILTAYLLLDQRNGGTQRELADIMNFRLGQLAVSEIAPFLNGFCGDFVRGVEQLAGTTANTSEIGFDNCFVVLSC